MEKEENQLHSVCVYGASSASVDTVYHDAAFRLGQLLGARGIHVINGAGNTGLMRAVSDGALGEGGRVTGVIPRFMVEQGWYHTGLTELQVVDTMHERKRRMAELSDAVVALPGGCGTLEELLEIITWKQLGLYFGPVVILNTAGYYDALLAMLSRVVDDRFMRPEHARHWAVAATPDEALRLIYTEPRSDESVRRAALT